ncbi:hypothetical protein Zmor_006166 [Zophobas morio]|uniref:Zinc finger PHD-type domain-containing protein n=1 Tax=Zophobas morio TaxID=2755281 RepID=A0AA38IX23_9CUCU|nr:hypothetical protein Zmor_006166 [Zophobas morio]
MSFDYCHATKNARDLEELKVKRENKRKVNVWQCKRNIFYKSSSRGEDGENEEEDDPFAVAANGEDEACLFYNVFENSRSREVWICCMKCKMSAHSECAGVSPKSKKFICEVCS